MVRFLRNATVAKIAGKDSGLLEISSEERERVARVAELFSEEDLTRHLQIMLRTHGELGYKQEQRFHLELGLLKMAHAQKLLPIEQLLSEVSLAPAAGRQTPSARPSMVSQQPPGPGRGEQSGRPNNVSPFAADSARKRTPRQEDAGSVLPLSAPRVVAEGSQSEPAIMGAVAARPASLGQPGTISNHREAGPSDAAGAAVAQAPERRGELEEPTSDHTPPDEIGKLRDAVLQALSGSGQNFLVSLLSGGEWSVEGNELLIRIAESPTVLDMSLSKDAKRLAIASASSALGRAVKLKVVPGVAITPQEKPNGGTPAPSRLGGRGRAEQDPIVRRMQEKFGAEIRTVIDYRDKR
jgi:DNA polymerase-3 subunit gamma/tau